MTMRAIATALFISAAAARASQAQAGTDTLPRLQLGEGRAQPNGRPVSIPDVAPNARARTSATPWSVRFARSVMQRNPQTHRRWDYTQGVILGAIERVALA